jgi:hypothetical protein
MNAVSREFPTFNFIPRAWWDRDPSSLIAASSECAAQIIDDRAARFVANVFRDGFDAIGEDPRCECSGLGDAVQL